MRNKKEKVTCNKKNQLVKELSIGDMLRIRGGDATSAGEPDPSDPVW